MERLPEDHRPLARRGAVKVCALRVCLVAVVVTLAVSGSGGYARVPIPSTAGETTTATPPGSGQSAEVVLPSQNPVREVQPAYVLPPVGWPTVDVTSPDPLLDRPYSAQPGCFANVETNVLWLHLHNRLSAPVTNAVTRQADQVMLGRAPLDAAAAPRFEVGYRIPDNWGSISFGYGFLATQGHEQSGTGPEDVVQVPTNKSARLVYNMFDLTYGSREYCLDPHWNMRWGVGARLMFLYFDDRGDVLNPTFTPGSVLAQSESNYLQSYGAWAYLDIERETCVPGLRGFFRLEGSDFFARVGQNYTESVVGNPGQGVQTSEAHFSGSVGPSILREVVGLTYTVPRWNYSRFMLGYQYEQFFQIGRLSPASGVVNTRGSLDANGLFLRAEFNF
jgi:hypothetical protein